MTTPPTPAGWYPDPDGSGGQRYWGGSGWTEHRAPSPEEMLAAAEPPAVAGPPGSEQPTTVVPTGSTPTEPRVGAHRAPDTEPEPEPSTQGPPPAFETPAFNWPSAPPASEIPAPDTPSAPPAFETPAFDTSPPPPPFPAPPSAPLFGAPLFDAPPPDGAQGNDSKLLAMYGAACAGLLALLVLAIVYGIFINDNETMEIETTGPSTRTETSAAPPTSGGPGWGGSTETATDSPTTVAETGEATDGTLSFVVHGVEVGTTVVSSEAPIEKTAVGEYVVVHMTVTNVGTEQTTFLGTFQKLKAGGTAYNIDDEATFYVGGGLADLPPGGSADVSVAFDVPPGTVAEAIELHADPISPGVEVPLS